MVALGIVDLRVRSIGQRARSIAGLRARRPPSSSLIVGCIREAVLPD